MPLAVANFATSGLEASLGVEAAKLLREGLRGNPLLDLKDSPRVTDQLGANSARVLTNKPGVAKSVADDLKCRVLVYGALWSAGEGARYVQLTGVDCRPRVARLYTSPPLAWPAEAAGQKQALLVALQAVLPPVGRVLAVITAGGQTQVQIFPFAGNALRTDTSYHAFRTHSADGAAAHPEFLPPLWAGAFAGRITTDGERLDDVIVAAPEEGAQVEVGDLVAIALTREVAASLPRGRLLLTEPPFAQVVKDGKVVGLTPLLLPEEALPGDFQLALTNYQPRPLALAAVQGLEAEQFARTELPRVGVVRVESDPPGALVLLDGKEVGKTPLVQPNVEAGKHTLSVRLPGYVSADREIQLARAGNAEERFTLERETRAVRIVSQPAGAEVTWNGEALGKAPALLARSFVGTHTLRLELEGYDALEQEVEVKSGDKPLELTFPLTKRAGKLRIVSDPPGAQIRLAGKASGTAPVDLSDLPPGEYEVTATLAGYREAQQKAEVRAHDTTTVELKLARQVGSIEIKTVPAGARVTLDGQERGTTPTTLKDVPVGDHALKLEAANLRAWEGKITVKDTETTRVEVGLLPLTVEMGAQPGVQPLPTPVPTPVPTPLPELPTVKPGDREFEGSDDPLSFPLLELGDGKARSWSTGLLRAGDAEGAPSDQLEIDFQPHADGSMTLALRTRRPLPPRVGLERTDGKLIVDLPGLRSAHNPAGVRTKEAPLHGIRATNTGAEGGLQLTVTLASRAEVTSSGAPEPTGELLLRIRRPLLMGNAKPIALTFDDLPFAGYTERLLQILREYRVVATFFVVGQKAANMPDLVRQAFDDGHSIQNHSYTHPKLTTLTNEQVKSELQRCNEVIKQITGKTPRFYRAPGGGDNPEVNRVAKALGLAAAGWDVNVHDYDTPDAQLIADRVVQGCRPGDIILLHDGVIPTMTALPDIITRLRSKGFVFVTMEQLLAAQQP